jgi:hypothetical protein
VQGCREEAHLQPRMVRDALTTLQHTRTCSRARMPDARPPHLPPPPLPPPLPPPPPAPPAPPAAALAALAAAVAEEAAAVALRNSSRTV